MPEPGPGHERPRCAPWPPIGDGDVVVAVRIAGEVRVVELAGALDVMVGDVLRAVFGEDGEDSRHLVVDLTRVTMIDSIVLGVLVRAHQAVKRRGGVVCLVGASRFLGTVLHTMCLHRVFPLFDTAEDACTWLADDTGAGIDLWTADGHAQGA